MALMALDHTRTFLTKNRCSPCRALLALLQDAFRQ